MNTSFKMDNSMPPEDRMIKIESDIGTLQTGVNTLQKDVHSLQKDVHTLQSDVRELKSEVKATNVRVNESIIANAKESATLRADMEKGFGSLRTEIEKNKAEPEKNFGLLRTEIEKSRTEAEKNFGSLKASIESAKLWMLVTGVGSVIVITFVTFLGRVLKLF